MSIGPHPSRQAGPAPAPRRHLHPTESGQATPTLTYGHAWGIFTAGVAAIVLCGLTIVVVARIPSRAPAGELPPTMTPETVVAVAVQPGNEVEPVIPVSPPVEPAPPPPVKPPAPVPEPAPALPPIEPPAREPSPEPAVVPPPAVEVPPPPRKVDETCGTSIRFLPNQTEAARTAMKEGKLLFLLHISGNFEDTAFT